MGFDSFVILGAMRTGSNLLEDLLGQLPGVICHGEVFNPHFIGKRDRMEHLGRDLAARDADPLGMLAALRDGPGLNGFRLFHDHDPRVLAHVLADPGCAKIVLRRNPLESYVSLRIAAATDQWRLTNVKNLRPGRAAFEPDSFAAHLATLDGWYGHIRRALQTSGQCGFAIDYAELGDVAVLNGLAAWLGLEARLETADSRLKKQNPDATADKVENPDAMARALAALDPFGVWDRPDLEPRRGAGVPAFRAADGAALLFQPMPGGPLSPVLGWLAALEGVEEAALPGGFTRRSLTHWMAARPGHRAFTVLRHPVARGWAAFDGAIRSGRFPRICKALRRNHGLTLPEGRGDPATLRADFLGFLAFVRANLAGQTAVRVDPLWASQTALLRGFAAFRPPDAILREGASGLSQLAPQGPPPPAAEAPPPAAEGFADLDSLYDVQVEAAARAAWPADYTELGFADWR